MSDIHVYSFEELISEPGEKDRKYQSATEWSTMDWNEADEYAELHHYRIIDNTYTFEDSDLIKSYIEDEDRDGNPLKDDEDDEEDYRELACNACGGPLNVLGQLGMLLQYRCRNCGLDQTLG